jgi:methylated-DNA-protein-cysteine methyltransferase-like protein
MNEFYLKVYEIVRKIPHGRVSTYGSIARCLGSAKSSRLVGYAMNLSHQYDPSIPAHRVVNRNGLLTGKHHFATPTLMQELLEAEGIVVKEDKIQNFDKVFWDPCKML